MRRNQLYSTILWAATMGILILDPKTAFAGAQEGIDLCTRSVIPSLFPFFVLSTLLTGSAVGVRIPLLQPLSRLCRIPEGAEGLLLVGFLGGYPVGAQCIYHAWKDGSLDTTDARRMMGFCNNAGPAFLFGMTSSLFSSMGAVWCLWGVQILSILITARILPGASNHDATMKSGEKLTVSRALERGVRNMGCVCGWVVLFRVVIAFGQRWILWMFPQELKLLLTGMIELTNGCCAMGALPSEGIRFLLCSMCLSFGGLCVGMQTVSVTKELGTGLYFPGKILQSILSFMLAQIFIPILFPQDPVRIHPLICAVCIGCLAISVNFLKFRKNDNRNPAVTVV